MTNNQICQHFIREHYYFTNCNRTRVRLHWEILIPEKWLVVETLRRIIDTTFGQDMFNRQWKWNSQDKMMHSDPLTESEPPCVFKKQEDAIEFVKMYLIAIGKC